MVSLSKHPGDFDTSPGRGVTASEHGEAWWPFGKNVQSGQASGCIRLEGASAHLFCEVFWSEQLWKQASF